MSRITKKLSKLVSGEQNVVNYRRSRELGGGFPAAMEVLTMPRERVELPTNRPMPKSPIKSPITSTIPGEQTIAVGENSEGTKAIVMEIDSFTDLNPIIQFSIDYSTGVKGTDPILPLRIGSVVNPSDAYALFGLDPSASDSAIISDEFGVGCLKVQGFSKLINENNIMVPEIHIISDDLTQLNAPFVHKQIFFSDMTVIPRTTNIAFSQEKSDFRQNLNVIAGKYWLTSSQWLETKIYPGAKVTILLMAAAVANAKGVTVIPHAEM